MALGIPPPIQEPLDYGTNLRITSPLWVRWFEEFRTGEGLPDASESAKGIVELATSAETITGTDTERAVTPAGLQSKAASTTAKGIVELATSAETITGTDNTRAVTPAGLQAKIASETAQGIVELATSTETETGTDTTRAVTPAGLASVIAWGTYTPTLTNIANLDGSTTQVCQWMRVGDVVTVSGFFSVNPTAAGTVYSLRASLPVASNFGGSNQGGGTFAYADATECGIIRSDAATDEVIFAGVAVSTASHNIWFTFTYLII
jgi:hypothetical protein